VWTLACPDAVVATGVGRTAAHGRGQEGWGVVVEARPVDAARQRASEIRGQSPARLMELTPSVYTQLT